MESGGYFMSDSAEEQPMECPACKNGHFVTQMEIDTNRCWYCGGSINKEDEVMSENYQYAECKHCGKSVMEGEIHSCKKMFLAEIEELKERVEKWKTWHDSASEDAKKWRRDAQELQGVVNEIRAELQSRAIHLLSKHCWCEPTGHPWIQKGTVA